ncbi:MAG: CesT family type III secretion system chaperone [Verrucomicrobiota bacterium]|nr:CesT family type III secretion system chaperone [Verrucomicrobiota bacterium]
MTNTFLYLLEEFGKIIHLPLRVDQKGACSLLLPEEFLVQLQPDNAEQNLFFFAPIVPLPPGKYREEVLLEGLKTNASQDPLFGTVAYLEKSNELVLYQSYPLNMLDGERLANLFAGFVEMGMQWKKAILAGKTHPQ